MRRIKEVVAVVVLLLGMPATVIGGNLCGSPYSEEETQNLCRGLAENIKEGIPPDQVIGAAVDSVLREVCVGSRGTFGEDGCYEVSRIQIQLFYETEESSVIDSFSDLGDKSDYETIIVRSCQLGDRTDAKDEFASASVQIFLKESKDISLKMSTDKTVLKPGETAAVKAQLACGRCGLENKVISFGTFGTGEITPEEARTGEDGKAGMHFTMKGEEDAVVTARCEDAADDITIRSPSLLWRIDIAMEHTNTYCKHMAPDWSILRRVREVDWQYSVRFSDISLKTGIARIQEFMHQGPAGLEIPGLDATPADMSAVWKILGNYRSEGTVKGRIRQLRTHVEKSPDAFYWATYRIEGSPMCSIGFGEAMDDQGNPVPDAIGFGLSLDHAKVIGEDGGVETYHFKAGAGLSQEVIPTSKIQERKQFTLTFDNKWGDDCEKDWGAPSWHMKISFTPQL